MNLSSTNLQSLRIDATQNLEYGSEPPPFDLSSPGVGSTPASPAWPVASAGAAVESGRHSAWQGPGPWIARLRGTLKTVWCPFEPTQQGSLKERHSQCRESGKAEKMRNPSGLPFGDT